jgi:hypothetical protein
MIAGPDGCPLTSPRNPFLSALSKDLRHARSNFRMAESKFGMLTMHDHNKIALSLFAGDAILGINYK